MAGNRPPQITTAHLGRLAIVYLRQSTRVQVERNTGSTTHQRGQKAYALQWGWSETTTLVIDEDLGLSGTSGEHRSGWQRLLKLVAEGRVGIIFVSDISRLSRSRRDFAGLVELCRQFDVLLVVDGSVVDFDDPTNRFMANIRADVAEYDNELRKETFIKAARAKARQGHAVRRPPIGYEVSAKGQWVKDRDVSVRQAVERLFRDIPSMGTVGKLLRHYYKHNIKFPARVAGELRWVPPSRARLYQVLTHPAYKGAYTFGRRVAVRGGSRRQTDPNKVIVVPRHHEPFIDSAQWDQIQAQLHRNSPAIRQPAGRGSALVQGLIRCGRCNRAMCVHFYKLRHGESYTYRCIQGYAQRGAPNCWSVSGPRLDEVVAAELLRSLRPPTLEAVIAAAGDVNAGYEAACQQRAADLARAQYAVKLARRRYEKVDPENRLVALGLEQDLERALEKLGKLERQHAETPLVPPLTPTPEVIAGIHQLSRDLPALWASRSTTHQDRKNLLRIFIQSVRLVANNGITFEIEIVWGGGAVTSHTILHGDGPARLARQMKAQGLTDPEIVQELNRRGMRTKYRRKPYTRAEIQAIFRTDGKRRPPKDARPWRTRREELRPLITNLVGAGLNDVAIAAELNRRGLPGFSPGRPWSKEKIFRLRQAWQIPAKRRGSVSKYEHLRPLLTELAKTYDDARIAAELTHRGIPYPRAGSPWTAQKVGYARLRLGIRLDWRTSPPWLSILDGDPEAP